MFKIAHKYEPLALQVSINGYSMAADILVQVAIVMATPCRFPPF